FYFSSAQVLRPSILTGNHHKDEFIAISFSGVADTDNLTGLHYRDTIRCFQHILHNVGDINDTPAPLTKPLSKIENMFCLCHSPTGSRFVHDNDPGVETNTLSNRD